MLQTDARESARLAFTQRQKFVAGYDKSGNTFGDALGTSTARIVEMETGRRRHMIAPDGNRRWNRAGGERRSKAIFSQCDYKAVEESSPAFFSK